MAITSMDGLVSAMATGQSLKFYFPSATVSAGNYYSLNTLISGSFGQLANPQAAVFGGQTYTQGTGAGQGWPIWTAAGGGNLSYLSRFTFGSNIAQMIVLYDLLWGCSGFNATLTTSQPVTAFTGLPSPARAAANGSGLELWVVCFTATGATSSLMTVSYTNQAGTSGRTSQTVYVNSLTAGQMKIVPLQNGDSGIQSVQSITLSASTTTAGNFGLFIMNRLTSASLAVGGSNVVADFAGTGLPIISDNAVLLLNSLSAGSSNGTIVGQADIVQG